MPYYWKNFLAKVQKAKNLKKFLKRCPITDPSSYAGACKATISYIRIPQKCYVKTTNENRKKIHGKKVVLGRNHKSRNEIGISVPNFAKSGSNRSFLLIFKFSFHQNFLLKIIEISTN